MRGDRRSWDASGAGDRDLERLCRAGRLGSGTTNSVLGPDVAASWEVFGVGGSKLTAGIWVDVGWRGGGMVDEGGSL